MTPYEASAEDQFEAPKGAARPIGNIQKRITRGKAGATVATAAMAQARSQRPSLRDFEIVGDCGAVDSVAGESGSGAVLMDCECLMVGTGSQLQRANGKQLP
jgi:hypothetical protein